MAGGKERGSQARPGMSASTARQACAVCVHARGNVQGRGQSKCEVGRREQAEKNAPNLI